ncbi:hypothetical protein D3C71_1494990 [compost metagenome]
MRLRPGQFGRGVTGQDGVAGQRDGARWSAECVHDLHALGRGAGVAPQLGRREDLPRSVDRYEAVLLPRDRQRGDAGTNLGIDRTKAGLKGRDPRGRLLLTAAIDGGRQLQR